MAPLVALQLCATLYNVGVEDRECDGSRIPAPSKVGVECVACMSNTSTFVSEFMVGFEIGFRVGDAVGNSLRIHVGCSTSTFRTVCIAVVSMTKYVPLCPRARRAQGVISVCWKISVGLWHICGSILRMLLQFANTRDDWDSCLDRRMCPSNSTAQLPCCSYAAPSGPALLPAGSGSSMPWTFRKAWRARDSRGTYR